MQKTKTICDACFKEVTTGYFKSATLYFLINEYGGGSIGGSEDMFYQNADLCEDCAHKLQHFLDNELGLYPTHEENVIRYPRERRGL